MIIPSSSALKAALIHNRSVFDLKTASRRDSDLAPSFATVPPPYESRAASLALNDAGELLAVSRAGHLHSDTSSYEYNHHQDNSDDGFSQGSSSEYGSTLRRHQFHWHDDHRRETLVIQVQNTLFKIQPAFLEGYSPLLLELIRSLKSHPEFSRDGIEGCKTIYWPEARAQEVAELLNRIYHITRNAPDASGELSLRSTISLVVPVVQYALRHSPPLRAKCILVMEKIIPTNTPALINRNRKGALRCQGDTAFRILHLVRAAGPDARDMLPFAFFLCARASTADIVETSWLGWEDKALCLAGRDEISRILRFEIYRKYTESATFAPSRCTKDPMCSTSVAAARTLDKHLSVEIFGFFTKVDCVCCVACAQEMHKEVKESWLSRVWDNLPQLFRLSKWESLRQGQRVPGD